MRVALALATAFVPAAVFAAADPLDTWMRCDADEQCIAVQGVCDPAAVNVQYDKQAQAYFKERAAEASCVQRFWMPSLSDARAKCWQQRCQIVGK